MDDDTAKWVLGVWGKNLEVIKAIETKNIIVKKGNTAEIVYRLLDPFFEMKLTRKMYKILPRKHIGPIEIESKSPKIWYAILKSSLSKYLSIQCFQKAYRTTQKFYSKRKYIDSLLSSSLAGFLAFPRNYRHANSFSEEIERFCSSRSTWIKPGGLNAIASLTPVQDKYLTYVEAALSMDLRNFEGACWNCIRLWLQPSQAKRLRTAQLERLRLILKNKFRGYQRYFCKSTYADIEREIEKRQRRKK